ncbi:hypothetical protein QR680_000499 [Steinernema hermaphroditum]|uniref:Uncharacterized protein n=1 Tax=Steinernema hermaphroditum TaxID=289476 RepID=A0AA39GVK0_9BILA|nr:hypothetical protein QR680_000499 [Steinernema hermaphroditum]
MLNELNRPTYTLKKVGIILLISAVGALLLRVTGLLARNARPLTYCEHKVVHDLMLLCGALPDHEGNMQCLQDCANCTFPGDFLGLRRKASSLCCQNGDCTPNDLKAFCCTKDPWCNCKHQGRIWDLPEDW